MQGVSIDRRRPVFRGRDLPLAGLLLVPFPALASDFTALFVWIVEIPISGLSALFLLVCLGAPKVGLVLSVMLLIGSLFIMGWAAEGYIDSAGGVLTLSLLVDIAAILVAEKRMRSAKAPGPAADA